MSSSSFPLMIKGFLCRLLFFSGMAEHKINQLAKRDALILMYHRILPMDKVDGSIEPGMYVTTESFSRHLSYLAQYFEILPLASLIFDSSLFLCDKVKPRCAITFDDGWLDFLLHAFPVLQRFNAPATVFLPTNFIGTDKEFWTDAVAKLLLHEQLLRQSLTTTSANADTLRSNIIVERILRADAASEEGRLDQVVSSLKCYRAEDIYRALDELRSIGAANATADRVFLNWDEVRSLKDTGLVTFGSHTAGHNILTTIEADEVCRELSLSKEKMIAEKVILAEEPLLFCYPNGNSNSDIAALVASAGYAGAVTTKEGWNGCCVNRFLLNRIGLHEDMSSTQAMFACRLAGLI
ncbi:MAG: polysaccharide deacetylase family protein [Proteobacteria bacterium]|nr:polysaccharide deacetylase family protein [Desulfobulbaceae bacterium]MBU4154005.1 polysaccharide deacetylase family protein [Pseudomonadota bacterium]